MKLSETSRYHNMSQILFTRLKSALKARGLTYSDIADRLGIAEITVKRIFADQDCKLSRLNAICRVAGLSLDELIEATEQDLATASHLTPDQSRALSANRSLLSVFLLLLNRYPPKRIQSIHQLSEPTLYRYLRALEQLHLIRLSDGGDAELLVSPPIDFLAHKSLDREIRGINADFLTWTFDHRHDNNYRFESVSRHLSQASADEVQRDIQALDEKIKRLAQRDYLLVPATELTGFKLSCAFGLTPFDQLFLVREEDAPNLIASPPLA